jgi:hypothetical protein
VTKKGYIYPVKTRIKKGNRIWVDKNTGEPVLKWLCTNPVAKKLPVAPRVVNVEKMTPLATTGRVSQQEEVAPVVPSEPTPEVTAMPVEPRAQVESAAPIEPAPAPEPVVESPIVKVPIAIKNPVSFHIEKVGIPVALLLSQVGGSSNSVSLKRPSTTPKPNPSPKPNALPEPGTIGLVLTGVGLLAARRRKKAR